MKKLKNALLLLLSVCMIFGTTTSYYAATQSLTATATKSRIQARYEHGTAVSLLRLRMDYTVKDDQKTYSDHQYATLSGGYSSISDARAVTYGREYVCLDVYAYVNGVQTATLTDITAK